MAEEEYKELYVPAATAIPESTVRWWTRYMLRRRFGSEQEAREEVFARRQHHDRQSWTAIFGEEGESKNRWFADNIPVYQDRWGKWKIGRPMSAFVVKQQSHKDNRLTKRYLDQVRARAGKPVQEYLSNNTSDMSDGTNGEPSAPSADYAGGELSVAGLPDYKYVERKKARHQKLRALLQRRDPGGRSTNLWDQNIRKLLGEEGEDILGDVTDSDITLEPAKSFNQGVEVHVASTGQWLGTVYKETDPVHLRLLPNMSWVAYPLVTNRGMPSYHKTRGEAISMLLRYRKPLAESEAEDDLVKDLGVPNAVLEPSHHAPDWYFNVSDSAGRFIGSVYKDQQAGKHKTTDTLQQLWLEFPWISWPPASGQISGRHRTKEEAVAYLRSLDMKQPAHALPKEFFDRHDELIKQRHERERTPEAPLPESASVVVDLLLESEEDFEEVGGYMPPWDQPEGVTFDGLEIAPIILRGPDGQQVPKGTEVANEDRAGTGDDLSQATWAVFGHAMGLGLYDLLALDTREEAEDVAKRFCAQHGISYFVDLPESLVQENEEDDSLVKDVSGDVAMTLEEFVRSYQAIPLSGYARNVFQKHWFSPREVTRLFNTATDQGLRIMEHVWTIKRDPNKQEFYLMPGYLPQVGQGEDILVFGYFLTRVPSDGGRIVRVSNSDVIDNQAYLW